MFKANENILNTIIEGNQVEYTLYLHFSSVGIIYVYDKGVITFGPQQTFLHKKKLEDSFFKQFKKTLHLLPISNLSNL